MLNHYSRQTDFVNIKYTILNRFSPLLPYNRKTKDILYVPSKQVSRTPTGLRTTPVSNTFPLASRGAEIGDPLA